MSKKINFDEDVPLTNESLVELTRLAEKQCELEVALAEAELRVKELRKDLVNIQERDLPSAMQVIGMDSFTLKNGKRISVDEIMYASIAKKNKHAAIEWLVSHDQSALVKTDIIVPFDKGDLDKAIACLEQLTGAGYESSMEENVNTSSVKAVIKELLAQGIDVPLELFGAHFVRRAKITT